ncbi:MAG: aminotransferase class V-fold PLP-dependent enzyme [Pseudohongiellaceae bacterium]
MNNPSNHSRRQFLQASSALLLAGVTSASRAQSVPGNGDYWQQVRAQFSFEEAAVPMNAANLCPSFRAVAERVSQLTADIDHDCSFNNRAKFAAMLEDSRARVAKQLNVSADEIALVRNTSEANNIINNGLPLSEGDRVLLWDQNHPTNNVAWDVRAARFGLHIDRVSTPVQPQNAQQLIDAFAAKLSDRTRVLAITHVSNLSGIALPVTELTAMAHARGIHVHLDGAQSWGALQVDLRALGVDSYSASAHKWYMGPKEVGLLYVNQASIEKLWPSVVAPGWGNSAETTLTGARKFESLGQRDDAALAGLGLCAEIHDRIGPARIQARISELAQRLKTGLTEAGIQLVTPMDPSLSHGVCILRVPDGQGGNLSNRLYNEHGIAAAATGGLRLCPTIYNTEQHIDRAIAGVRALMV